MSRTAANDQRLAVVRPEQEPDGHDRSGPAPAGAVVRLGELLAAPPLKQARQIAGRSAARDGAVLRAVVIERESVGFIRPGEVVMTVGVGLGQAQLTRFLIELTDSPAAAVIVSLPRREGTPEISQAVIEAADARAKPLIDLPWEVAFSRISEWLEAEHVARAGAGQLHGRFMAALSGGAGPEIAATLESVLDRPVLLFDALMQPIAHSPATAAALGPAALREVAVRAADCEPAAVERMIDSVAAAGARVPVRLPELGLPAGIAMIARARHQSLGVVFVLGGDLDACGRHALCLAADTLAVDRARWRSGSEANLHEREELVWELASAPGEADDHMLRRAAAAGLDVRARYEVAVGEGPEEDLFLVSRACARANLLQGDALGYLSPEQGLLLLAVPAGGRRVLPGLLEGLGPDGAVSWGLAARPRPLLELGAAFREARRALAVGEPHRGGTVCVDAAQLAPQMMLSTLVEDATARDVVDQTLGSLRRYDAARHTQLFETLDVYLKEGANASGAARRLSLNRHSLHYRLRRIEELTGRSLADPSDRFVLQLCVLLVRMAAAGDSA